MQFAKEYGVKLVCTNDCHFEDKEVFVVIAKNSVSARGIIQIVGLETRTNPRHVNVVDVEKVVSI